MACTVDLIWDHNHSTTALQTLSFKDILPSTVEQVKEYFKSGLSPGKIGTTFINIR